MKNAESHLFRQIDSKVTFVFCYCYYKYFVFFRKAFPGCYSERISHSAFDLLLYTTPLTSCGEILLIYVIDAFYETQIKIDSQKKDSIELRKSCLPEYFVGILPIVDSVNSTYGPSNALMNPLMGIKSDLSVECLKFQSPTNRASCSSSKEVTLQACTQTV